MNPTDQWPLRHATIKDFIAVKELLLSENLPVEDLPAELSHFFVVENMDRIVAVAGLEIYGDAGLVRSIVVKPEYRGHSMAGNLVARLTSHAVEQKLSSLYLLTTTAEKYFLKKGFKVIKREMAPSSIASSREFITLCPSTATIMMKEL